MSPENPEEDRQPPAVDPTMRALSLAMAAQKDKGLGDYIEETLSDATDRAHMGTFRRIGHRISTLFNTAEERGEK